MTLGSLRDQIIYPDTYEEMLRKGKRDDDLLTYLDLVKLTYIQERDGGWDAVADWMDVLSGGEKQRIAVSPAVFLYRNVSDSSFICCFSSRWPAYSTTNLNSPFWTNARRP